MIQTAPVGMWHDLDSAPVYNIKAVVEATGLPAATLRAWERRYGTLNPGRTANGYRLYSAQDVALLRWLKARVDAGVNISQAIALAAQHVREQTAPPPEQFSADSGGIGWARAALVTALLAFDEVRADQVLEEAFATLGPESVGEQLIAHAMVQIGNYWHRGKITTAGEHFASNYLRRKLDAVINAAPKRAGDALIVLGCAPDDWHELGLLLIHLALRRRGHRVLYLGQNVPVAQFADEMRRLKPMLVLMSASTVETVGGLIELARAVEAMTPPRPHFGFGGAVFNAHPDLRAAVPGVFLGETAHAAVQNVEALLGAAGSADPLPQERDLSSARLKASYGM